jgi:putative nucleotidyltransferase with HDIG domain
VYRAKDVQKVFGDGGSDVAALEVILYADQCGTDQVFHDLAESIHERDLFTYEHCQRVSGYAERLARRMGWDQHDAHQLALAAFVHDVGKTWIGNDILLKETALSREERLLMERHPIMGAQMLAGYDLDAFFIETVLHHHESYDGYGYPQGLQGEAIPIGARMLTVVDVYDALLSSRPYKAALSPEAVEQHLLAESGRRFDPRIVTAFLHALAPEADRIITRRLYTMTKNLACQIEVGEAASVTSSRRPGGPLLVSCSDQ